PPPPTALFTLSLHDALPICSRSRSFSIKPGPLPSFRKLLQPEPDQPRGIHALARAARRGGHGRRGLRLAVAEIDQRGDCVHDRLDRKSTRLNSSHVAISYAV